MSFTGTWYDYEFQVEYEDQGHFEVKGTCDIEFDHDHFGLTPRWSPREAVNAKIEWVRIEGVKVDVDKWPDAIEERIDVTDIEEPEPPEEW